ncbi:hypothetical protein Chor_005015 [Crotalus horridus]
MNEGMILSSEILPLVNKDSYELKVTSFHCFVSRFRSTHLLLSKMSHYPNQSCYDPCRPRHFSSGSSLSGSKYRTHFSSGSCYGNYGRGIRYSPPCGYGYQRPSYGGICYQPVGYDYGYGYGNRYCPPLSYGGYGSRGCGSGGYGSGGYGSGGYGSGGYNYGCQYGGLYGRRQSISCDPFYRPRCCKSQH